MEAFPRKVKNQKINNITATHFSNPNFLYCLAYDVPIPKAKSHGVVHSAKNNITSHPDNALHEAKAINCTDWLNPQGIKKVKAPTKSGIIFVFFTLKRSVKEWTFDEIHFINLKRTPRIEHPKYKNTNERIIPVQSVKPNEREIVSPKKPRSDHNTKNVTYLQICTNP